MEIFFFVIRRHIAIFPPGILDKHYEKLLQSDPRLFVLNQKPFPSEKSPYFHSNTSAPTQFSFDFNRFGHEFSPRCEVPVSNFLIPVLAPYHVLNFNNTRRSPLAIMDTYTMSGTFVVPFFTCIFSYFLNSAKLTLFLCILFIQMVVT